MALFDKIITPAFNSEKPTAIFMATNERYAPPTAVAIKSIIDHADPNKNYDIVIANGGNKRSQKWLKSMATNNISIRIIDISSLLKNRHFHIVLKRFSVETYARFFIPGIFEKYDHVLWLDSDIIVLKDIAELINIDMGNNWWAGSEDIGFLNKVYRNHFNKIMYPYKITDYLQAGIVVWNIPECRKSNLTSLLFDTLRDMGPPFLQDQDVINTVAKGKNRIFKIYKLWNVSDIMNIESPYIIHFSRKFKPWHARPRQEYDDYFWLYAKKTRFYRTIRFRQKIDFFTRNIKKILRLWKNDDYE